MSHDGAAFGSDGRPHPDVTRISVTLQPPPPPDALMSDADDASALSFGSLNGDFGGRPPASALDLSLATAFDVVKEARKVIRAFLLEHQCYELIKNSGKVRRQKSVAGGERYAPFSLTYVVMTTGGGVRREDPDQLGVFRDGGAWCGHPLALSCCGEGVEWLGS